MTRKHIGRVLGSWVLAAVLVLVLGLAGCAGPERSGGGAAAGGTLRVAIVPGVVHLDPQDTDTRYAFEVTQYIFEQLVERDESGKIQPSLAREWSVSPDGLHWTFELQTGVKFHDGTEFNAQVAKYNLDRKMKEKKPLGDMLQEAVEQVVVVGDHTLRLDLKKPSPDLLGILASETFSMYSPAAVEKYGPDGLKTNPIGTGPFMLEDFRRDEFYNLVRFPDYWRKGLPHLDRVEIRVIADASTRAAMLQAGEVDVALRLNPVDLKRFKDNPGLGVKLVTMPVYDTRFMHLNNLHKPLDDKRVRLALNHAVDRKAIVDSVFHGFAVPQLTQIMPTTIYGYEDPGNHYDYNPELALSLLREAGWTRGTDGWLVNSKGQRLALNMWTRKGVTEGDYEMAQMVQEMLRQVGVDVKMTVIDSATARAKATVPPDKAEYDMLNWGMGQFTGHMEYGMNTFFASSAWAPKYYNRSYYRNAEVDELIAKGNAASTPEERYRFYNEALKIAQQDAPTLPLISVLGVVAVRSNVEGVWVDPAAITFPAKFARLTK